MAHQSEAELETLIGKAKEYLDTTAFSKKGLIKQLKFEGFTEKQASYGVKHVYK